MVKKRTCVRCFERGGILLDYGERLVPYKHWLKFPVNKKFYDKYFGKTGWRANTIRSLSIGQGEVLVTPLQLANGLAAIANRGYYITPHLNKSDSMLTHKHKTSIDAKYFAIVDEGMWRVNEFGTGRAYKIPGVSSCGKTGTVQNNRGKDHA